MNTIPRFETLLLFLARLIRWRVSAIGALCTGVLLSLVLCEPAMAVPSFARQTGQSCVACHAGGQFPELTPYGRLFKLTGYTMGERSNPLAVMLVASSTTTQNNDSGGMNPPHNALNGPAILDFASIFIAGKASDNIGGFAQYTNSFYDSQDANGVWHNRFVADNFDLRYADRSVDANRDLIWGLTLHNNPTVQDVWNSTPAWGYPYVSTTQAENGSLPVGTLLEGGLAQHAAGVGAYFYLNKTFYGELTSYQTAKGALSFLSYGNQPGDTAAPLFQLDGNSIYWRLAYTKEWDAHNIMLGAMGLDAKAFQNDPATGLPFAGLGSTHYQDVGIDAQYQYLLAPHTLTAHFRSVWEKIDDASAQIYSDGPANLNSTMAKVSYVYREKYGGSLAYTSVAGSPDILAYSGLGPQNVPDSERWTPELFWLINQNTRVGAQFNLFTRYAGATSNYDGTGRSPGDNNTTYLYLWTAF